MREEGKGGGRRGKKSGEKKREIRRRREPAGKTCVTRLHAMFAGGSLFSTFFIISRQRPYAFICLCRILF